MNLSLKATQDTNTAVGDPKMGKGKQMTEKKNGPITAIRRQERGNWVRAKTISREQNFISMFLKYQEEYGSNCNTKNSSKIIPAGLRFLVRPASKKGASASELKSDLKSQIRKR